VHVDYPRLPLVSHSCPFCCLLVSRTPPPPRATAVLCGTGPGASTLYTVVLRQVELQGSARRVIVMLSMFRSLSSSDALDPPIFKFRF
jgi:hypothetical protein